jgi:hypothetical protein
LYGLIFDPVFKVLPFHFPQMSEDLAKQLASYKAQLQQVEAALSGNGENEDLIQLKKDLQVSVGGLCCK